MAGRWAFFSGKTGRSIAGRRASIRQERGTPSKREKIRMTNSSMQRTLGLGGTVAIIVGYVVGASIFILPGQLAHTAGPGLFISFLIAAVFAMFICGICAQVGSALPISGAGYVLVSRALSPFAGFMYFWTTMLCISVAIPLVAYGFADYLSFFLPGIHPMTTAVTIIAVCTLINILGVGIASSIQTLLVIEFIAALLIFGIGGMFHLKSDHFVPLFPMGIKPVFLMAIPACFSYTGFVVITSLGDEIKKPSRTIPLGLLISLSVIVLVYTLVAIAVPGILPWQTLDQVSAPVAAASKLFLPSWLADLIAGSALAAAFTSVNGALLGQARDCYAVAGDRILPWPFTYVSPRFKTPVAAILLVAALAVIGTVCGSSIKDYAILTVIGFTILKCLLSVATIRLPAKLPESYARARFKLGPVGRLFFPAGLILFALAFLFVGSAHNLTQSVVLISILMLGALYYRIRRFQLNHRNNCKLLIVNYE
ncbi:MAG: amino acid permease [Desulfobacteraceae bacterium]|nr:MAG: amino acid permease [Desulfobacteraceae bacterium]